MTNSAGQRFACPACGYPDLDEPAWTDEGGGSLEICPSCGIQFGYTDMAGGDLDKRKRLWEEWPKPTPRADPNFPKSS